MHSHSGPSRIAYISKKPQCDLAMLLSKVIHTLIMVEYYWKSFPDASLCFYYFHLSWPWCLSLLGLFLAGAFSVTIHLRIHCFFSQNLNWREIFSMSCRTDLKAKLIRLTDKVGFRINLTPICCSVKSIRKHYLLSVATRPGRGAGGSLHVGWLHSAIAAAKNSLRTLHMIITVQCVSLNLLINVCAQTQPL